jgi:sRNA-binding carbon storage regulator CsrA
MLIVTRKVTESLTISTDITVHREEVVDSVKREGPHQK